jgi:putative SOS response-associated peptidase YedK
MCYSNSSTSKNVDLAKKYKKTIPQDLSEEPVFYASGFSFPNWRVITKEEEIQSMHWGLIPHWFKEADPNKIAAMTLNAQIETVHEKASFRSIVGKKNCIIPSSGFFEWHTEGKEKIPYFLKPTSDIVFSMAGIYDEWVDRSTGEIVSTFSILTCPANELMGHIHNTKKRMPVLLPDEYLTSWLEGHLNTSNLLIPAPSKWIEPVQVSKKLVLSDYANTPEVQKEAPSQIGFQGSLF